MGRLDSLVEDPLLAEELEDELDILEPVDDLVEAKELDFSLAGICQVAMEKSSRRRLEERLEELRLKHQISDYDFKI